MSVRVKFKYADCCVTYYGFADCKVSGGSRGTSVEPGEAPSVEVEHIDCDGQTVDIGGKALSIGFLVQPQASDIVGPYLARLLELDPEFCDRAREAAL